MKILENKILFHILYNCRSKDRTTSPLSLASTNEDDAGSEPAQVSGGNSCSFLLLSVSCLSNTGEQYVSIVHMLHMVRIFYLFVLSGPATSKTHRVSRRGTGHDVILLLKGVVYRFVARRCNRFLTSYYSGTAPPHHTAITVRVARCCHWSYLFFLPSVSQEGLACPADGRGGGSIKISENQKDMRLADSALPVVSPFKHTQLHYRPNISPTLQFPYASTHRAIQIETFL